MKRTVLIYGLISGAIASGMMFLTQPFAGKIGSQMSYILGYTTIVLAALMVFFGIRSYRENTAAGRLTFLRGFTVGILITLISSVCYVGSWEFIYYRMMPDFAEKYAAQMIEHAKASGATGQKLAAVERSAHEFEVSYHNPLVNIPMTFMEIFPIGLAATLLSAVILRKKQEQAEAVPAGQG